MSWTKNKVDAFIKNQSPLSPPPFLFLTCINIDNIETSTATNSLFKSFLTGPTLLPSHPTPPLIPGKYFQGHQQLY